MLCSVYDVLIRLRSVVMTRFSRVVMTRFSRVVMTRLSTLVMCSVNYQKCVVSTIKCCIVFVV